MTTSTETTAPATPEAPAQTSPNVPRMIAGHLSDAWSNAAIAADAQVNIWTMKAVRLAVLAALALPIMAAAIALAVYGFVLLDRSFAFALAYPEYSRWVSPLVRGAVYFGIPMIALAAVWFSRVGTCDANSASESKCSETPGEARHAKL